MRLEVAGKGWMQSLSDGVYVYADFDWNKDKQAFRLRQWGLVQPMPECQTWIDAELVNWPVDGYKNRESYSEACKQWLRTCED
jgi:hypothetical protein